jgi:hypothetical protein
MGRLVIMILVDVANGKQRHVPYRDSKLTYLLQVIIIYCSHKSARGKYLVYGFENHAHVVFGSFL